MELPTHPRARQKEQRALRQRRQAQDITTSKRPRQLYRTGGPSDQMRRSHALTAFDLLEADER